MNAREAKSTAHAAAGGGKYEAAQVYATLYLAEVVVELTKLIESRYKPVTKHSDTGAGPYLGPYGSYRTGPE